MAIVGGMDTRGFGQSTLKGGATRAVYGIGALLALIVLVLVVPWVIIAWGEWTALADVVRHPSVLFGADDGRVVMGLLTVVGALSWVVLAICVVIEMVAWIRWGDKPLDTRGWLHFPRSLVRPLIAAVFSMVLATGGSQAMATPVDAPIVLVNDGQWGSEPSASTSDLRPGDDEPQFQSQGYTLTPQDSDSASLAEVTTVTVVPGDTLWGIAERVYSDGSQWRVIAEANAGLITSDVIHVGWNLKIPPLPTSDKVPSESIESVALAGEDDQARTVVVQEGDSLWGLAEVHLGDPLRWQDIATLNAHLLSDPDLIHTGWVLQLPSQDQPSSGLDEETEPAQESVPGENTVEAHDAMQFEEGRETSSVVVADLEEDTHAPTGSPGGTAGDSYPSESLPESESSVGAQAETEPSNGSPQQTTDSKSVPSDSERPTNSALAATGLGVLLAASVAYVLKKRRQGQLRERPVGRRIPHPSAPATRLETALGNRADEESAILGRLGPPTDSARVPLGLSDQGEPAWADLEESGTVTVAASASDDLDAAMAAACLGLASAEWSQGVEVHVVTREPEVFSGLEAVVCHPSSSSAMEVLQTTVEDRREGLSGRTLAQARESGADAYRPMVFAFADSGDMVSPTQVAQILESPSVGVSALVAVTETAATGHAGAGLAIDQSRRAVLEPSGLALTPSLLDDRDLIADLLKTTSSFDTTSAWWSAEAAASSANSEDSEMITDREEFPIPPSDPDPPTLLLLGPVELHATKGTPPVRAERSCVEYCCWLLEHPGSTAMQMTQGLMVAESTRRSTMSRLRTWLGVDSEGAAYLPEAYSGRIRLSPQVISDWAHLRQMIQRGIERTDTNTLVECLRLVRGEPLENVAPLGWHWSEELRTDMISVIRDIGIVVLRRCLEEGRVDEARWACQRALLGAPEDEMLLCSLMEIEHQAGNPLEVVRIGTRITRNARAQGVDLMPDTEDVLRKMLHPAREMAD